MEIHDLPKVTQFTMGLGWSSLPTPSLGLALFQAAASTETLPCRGEGALQQGGRKSFSFLAQRNRTKALVRRHPGGAWKPRSGLLCLLWLRRGQLQQTCKQHLPQPPGLRAEKQCQLVCTQAADLRNNPPAPRTVMSMSLGT